MKQFIKTRFSIIFFLLFISSLFAGCNEAPSLGVVAESSSTSSMAVHFIDVGQADCILFESDGHYLLVDAGKNDSAQLITDYLKKLGVKEIDYVIGTHPHEDHIGSLDTVITNFDVKTVIMPPVTHTSKTFSDVLTAIENKNLSITLPEFHAEYLFGSAKFTIVSPDFDYGNDLNNWSVGIRVTYGETSFLACGDMEQEAEQNTVNANHQLKSNVLKVNHHGSRTSTNQAFLDAVSPEYSVIMAGKDNSYGHPTADVLKRLEESGSTIFRTDISGTIIAVSDGHQISWNTETKASEVHIKNYAVTNSYILNTNTKKFHLESCSSVGKLKESNKEVSQLNRDELISQDYEPCKICNP